MLQGFVDFVTLLVESKERASRHDRENLDAKAEAVKLIYRAARLTQAQIEQKGLNQLDHDIAEAWAEAARRAVFFDTELALACRLKEVGWGMGWDNERTQEAFERGDNLSLAYLLEAAESLLSPSDKAEVESQITPTTDRISKIY